MSLFKKIYQKKFPTLKKTYFSMSCSNHSVSFMSFDQKNCNACHSWWNHDHSSAIFYENLLWHVVKFYVNIFSSPWMCFAHFHVIFNVPIQFSLRTTCLKCHFSHPTCCLNMRARRDCYEGVYKYKKLNFNFYHVHGINQCAF